ncbi:MAG: hypothetical protein ACOYUZ_03465 [Patescibacteria group bacterium]
MEKYFVLFTLILATFTAGCFSATPPSKFVCDCCRRPDCGPFEECVFPVADKGVRCPRGCDFRRRRPPIKVRINHNPNLH